MLILLTIYIFLQIVIYFIIADVILSWLSLFGLKFRPKFISNIIDPIYLSVKKRIPTSIGPVDLTPIVLMLIIYVIINILFIIFPELLVEVNKY